MDGERFLETLREELIEPTDVVDIESLRSALQRLEPPIDYLSRNPRDVGALLHDNAGRTLVGLLLGVAPSELEPPGRYPVAALSQWPDWTDGESLRGVVIGLLLRDAHVSRARRRRTKLADITAAELARISRRRGLSVRANPRIQSVGRSVDFLVENKEGPILAVVVIFQTRVGGRQMQIFDGLPELQSTLIREGIVLAVVADGPGFRSMSFVVQRVAPRLQHLMNAQGLEAGELRKAVLRAERVSRGERTIGDPASEELLDRIAQVALRTGRPVAASTLNLPVDEAEAFLLRFSAAHPEYDVRQLGDEGVIAESAEALGLLHRRGPSSAPWAPSIADRLGYPISPSIVRDGIHLFGIEIPDARLRLPSPLPVLELAVGRESSREELVTTADEMLRTGPLVARLGIVIDRGDPASSSVAAAAVAKAGGAQLAVLSDTDVAEILLRRRQDSRSYLTRRIVESIDLSFISPFVSEGPTPPAMFFGRDSEIGRIMEQAGRQSFALVGGRKAGKTSILRRLEVLLRQRGAVTSLDLQAHPDRADFLRYVMSETPKPPQIRHGSETPSAERILTAFVEQIFKSQPGSILLLDEVDDLFHADATAEQHPHVLSRALRSVAQAGKVSMVVTGERVLYGLTRDAGSPHWNFCTPLIIGPLADDDAIDLLADPLATLGIDVTRDALEAALARTARHPNLIQFLGDRLVSDLAGKSEGAERVTIDSSVVIEMSRMPAFSQRFATTFWSQSTALERVISIVTSATQTKTADELLRELRRLGARPSAGDVADALSYLELYTIVQPTQSGYRLREPIFGELLGQVRGTAIFSQWIEALQ